MPKLNSLTAVQLARLPEIRDEWLRIGLSQEPLDVDRAKDAATRAYQAAGLEPPKWWFSAQSPVSATIMATISSK